MKKLIYSKEDLDLILTLKLEEKDKEIERLKKREQECIDHYLVQCKYASEMESKYISANYVINELEKWLGNEIKRIKELQNPVKSKIKPYGEEYNNYTLIIGAYDNALDKLQELKGSDK